MILRAKYVLPVTAPPIENGAVAVEGDTIVALGRYGEVAGGEVRDLGEVVLAPGLINAHCHLDYTAFAGKVAYRGSFTAWLQAMIELKATVSDEQYVTAIRDGLRQLARSGTTTVVNHESFPKLIAAVGPVAQRVVWCPELIDFRREQPAAELLRQASQFMNAPGAYGLAPHAPYTVTAELYRQAATEARARQMPVSTHVAESTQEDDMFRRGLGPLYDFLRGAGREMDDCKRVGPVHLLSDYGVLGANCLAVHANCLTPADVKLLAESGTHVVHCPKTHRFFQRPMPPLASLWQSGVNVCLGTDSLASNDELNMFAEMQELARTFPRLSAEEILRLATVNPAKALNLPDKLGKIAPGAWADLMAVPVVEPVVDLYETVVFAEQSVCFAMVAGKVMDNE